MTCTLRRIVKGRWALGVFVAYLVVAFVLLLRWGRWHWFAGDEWAFIVGQDDLADLFRPLQTHWSTVPILVYQALFRIVGLHSYLPYQAVVVLLHLSLAALLRVVMRRGGVSPWIATVAAGTFVLSPRLTWGDGARLRAIAEQASLQHLVDVGERLQRDAASLLDRAAFDGEEIPAVAVEATARFADAEARAAFLDDYLALTAQLIEQHATSDGAAYTVVLVAHPTAEEQP